MKKIIIVNNNMKVGGVQKSLYNLLWETEGKYDVTLCLFKNIGAYADMLPPSVKVIEARGLFRYFGVSQGECKGFDALRRGFLAAFCKLFGRKKTVGLMLAGEKELPESYDCAVAFLHNGGSKSFYGGVWDYVLRRIKAERKVAFLHCDYRNCGSNNKENNADIARFDAIAACSDGCRAAFAEVLPDLADKCVTVRNCHRFDEIRALADEDPIIYSPDCFNIVTVARLSHEKGIERALKGVAEAVRRGLPVKYHIVGGGAMAQSLRMLASELGIEDSAVFYGEQSNPYRYMKNADLFLLPSYHEAAPMVIDEARCLALPVLTTRTTSSKDMVTDMGCGYVCGNSEDEIVNAICDAAKNRSEVSSLKEAMLAQEADNALAVAQFESLF